MSTTITCRISDDLSNELVMIAELERKSRSKIVRSALMRYFRHKEKLIFKQESLKTRKESLKVNKEFEDSTDN